VTDQSSGKLYLAADPTTNTFSPFLPHPTAETSENIVLPEAKSLGSRLRQIAVIGF